MSLIGLGAGILVNIEHDEAQRHLERRGVGQVALTALVDVELRRLELVGDEFQHRGAGEIGDRENRLENGLQALVRAAALRLLDHEELIVGRLLNLDEVRHLCDFGNFSKKLAYAPTTVKRKGLSHRRSFNLCIRACNGRGLAGQSIPSINGYSQSRPASRTRRPDCRSSSVRDHPLENPLPKSRFRRLLGNQFGGNDRGRTCLPRHIPILLDVDLGAGVFKLLLEVSGFSLGNGFLDRPSERLRRGPWLP